MVSTIVFSTFVNAMSAAGTSKFVATSASPAKLLEMQVLRPTPDLLNPLGVGISHLEFYKHAG